MKNKNLWNILIIGITSVGLVVALFTTHEGNELKDLIDSLDAKWLLVAFLCVVFSWLLEAQILHIITHRVCQREHYPDSLRVTMIGQFFNSVTPFSSGGQPAQIYCMVKNGVSVGQSTNILLFKSIIYQLTIFFYTLVLFLWRGDRMIQLIPNFMTFYIIGMSINLGIILFFGLFLFSPKAAEKVADFIFHLLHRFKIFKNVENYIHKKEAEIEGFKEGTKNMMRDMRTLVGSIFFQFLVLTVLFLIPYFIYLAVEIDWGDFPTMISSQALLRMITTMVPTPGASVGAEGVSYFFFKNFFRTAPIVPVILLFRIYTFYLNLLFGGLFILLSRKNSEIGMQSN